MAGDVLRKKLMAGQQAPAADGGPGADRAWRLAFARAARDMMHLPIDFLGQTVKRLSLAELLDLPPERALILMLEGPEDGLGLLILSPDLLTALVEVLTIGRCGMQAGDPRKPTRTDAAMLSPLADIALTNLEDALVEEADLVWTSGFRYASFIEDARPLGLLLDDVVYRTLTARLSLCNGARVGEMILVLPADGRGRKPRVQARDLTESLARPVFAAALGARVNGAAAQLDAVLARVSMPVAQVMHLSVDMVLALPKAQLDQVSVEGLDGRRVTAGRLGQHRGMRALRLTDESLVGCDLGSDARVSPSLGVNAATATTHAARNGGFALPEHDYHAFDATGTD